MNAHDSNVCSCADCERYNETLTTLHEVSISLNEAEQKLGKRENLVREVIDAFNSWKLATRTLGNSEARKDDIVTAARKLAEHKPESAAE